MNVTLLFSKSPLTISNFSFSYFRVQSLSCQFSSVHLFCQAHSSVKLLDFTVQTGQLKKTIYVGKWCLVTTIYVVL
jgi:hypothetical protein